MMHEMAAGEAPGPAHLERFRHGWTVFNYNLFEAFEFELQNIIPLNPLVPDTQNLLRYYNPVPYQRGAAFFRTLHLLIGNKSFRNILRKVTNFYSHHNISTSILHNLIKVMVRNFDEEDVCLLTEDLFEKFWNDSVLLPFYSAIQVTGFDHLPHDRELVVHFRAVEAQLGFDESIVQEFFAAGGPPEDLALLEKAARYHSSDELATDLLPCTVHINKAAVARRHNFFQIMVLDEHCKIRFENWCRLSLFEDKQIRIPGIDFVPAAVLMNGRFESYSRVFYDSKTVEFLLQDQRVLSLPEETLRLSLYMSLISKPSAPAESSAKQKETEAKLVACLKKESKVVIKLLSSRINIPTKL